MRQEGLQDAAHNNEGEQGDDSDEYGNLISVSRVLVTPLQICPQPAQWERREASTRILHQCSVAVCAYCSAPAGENHWGKHRLHRLGQLRLNSQCLPQHFRAINPPYHARRAASERSWPPLRVPRLL
jgi:hypothetical protein